MRHRSLWSLPLLAAAVLVQGCSGGNTTIPENPPGTLPPCSAGTQVQLARPLSGSQGNPSNPGTVQVVADATTDVFGTSWNVVMIDYVGNVSQGGLLVPATVPGSYRPFAKNFYYNATIPPLFPQDIYKAYVNKYKSSCQPLLVGSFTT